LIKVEFEYNTGNSTLLGLDSDIPESWTGKEVIIAGKKYKTEIVYDLPRHIAIIGNGTFKGKEVEFI
jgi:hypothetical protein